MNMKNMSKFHHPGFLVVNGSKFLLFVWFSFFGWELFSFQRRGAMRKTDAKVKPQLQVTKSRILGEKSVRLLGWLDFRVAGGIPGGWGGGKGVLFLF